MPKECCKDTWENKVKPDEPVFILRGQDALAVPIIQAWYNLALAKGVNEAKLKGVLEHMDAIYNFQEENPERVKLPD